MAIITSGQESEGLCNGCVKRSSEKSLPSLQKQTPISSGREGSF